MDNTASRQTKYALKRLIVGAFLGLILAFLGGYFFACYKYDINVCVGLGIFRNPMIGMGIIGLCFIGTVIGALASLFSKKLQ